MNKTQLQTTAAPLIAIAAGYAASHGWLGLDTGAWGTVLTALGAAGLVLWPAIVTRLQSLKDTVGKSGAVVVTNAVSANALPNNPNVIAAGSATSAVVQTAK